MTDILFVTDGGPEEGMGHIYRSLTVANAIDDRLSVSFLVTSDTSVAREKIRASDFELLSARRPLDAQDQLGHQKTVIDLPHLGIDLLREVRTDRIVVYGNPDTNIPEESFGYSDVVINPLDVREGFGGKVTERDGTDYLVGPSYMMFREEFSKYAGTFRTDGLDKILLTFGGADPANLTSRFIQEIADNNSELTVDVVLGPAFTDEDSINDIVTDENSDRINFFMDVDCIAELMASADLVFTSPGLTMLESLYLGVPTVGIYQHRDHKTIYGDIEFVYDTSEIDDLMKIVERTYRRFLDGDVTSQIGTRKEDVVAAILGE